VGKINHRAPKFYFLKDEDLNEILETEGSEILESATQKF
jgi:hypothetical protein